MQICQSSSLPTSIMNKLYKTLIVLAVLSGAALGALPREKKLSFLKECEEEHKTGLNIEEILDKWLIPESKEGQCLMECFVLKKGLINKNAEIDHKTATPHFIESFPGDQTSVDKAEQALAECDKLDLSKKDHCERAVAVLKCFRENAKKIGLKH
ncbi:general odorant-binding protein 1-like [Macrosteles quadrilineatus]|uniref:general odorant-binding protein 1-like n=1 Tax=Macrosteles quadrilineatus TaxID=74068 RepID=UPI0023E128D3|nr:general odorant-binding protein 1-like [Macrosteles quadrilineatus]